MTAFLFHFVGAVVGGVGVHLPVSAPYREPCQEVVKTDPGLAGILLCLGQGFLFEKGKGIESLIGIIGWL